MYIQCNWRYGRKGEWVFFSEHSVDYLQIDRQSNVHECICGTDGQYNCHWCCQIVVDLYLYLKFPWRCHGLAEFFPKRWISAFDMEILSYYTFVIYDFDLLLIELLSIHCILRVKLTFLQPALTVRLLTVFKASVQLWFHCSLMWETQNSIFVSLYSFCICWTWPPCMWM